MAIGVVLCNIFKNTQLRQSGAKPFLALLCFVAQIFDKSSYRMDKPLRGKGLTGSS